MYTPKLEKDIRCPLEYGLTAFGGKWKSRVIYILAEKGTLRYSAIREEMTNITDAVLASTLKKLITDEIIRRQQFNEIPPRGEYELTQKGRSVSPSCKPFVNGLARIIGKITKTRCTMSKMRLPHAEQIGRYQKRGIAPHAPTPQRDNMPETPR